MEIVLLLVGGFFVAIGALFLFSEARTRSGSMEVFGELIGFSTGTNASGGGSYYAIARYAGLDGQTRYVQSSVGSSQPLGTIGDALKVCVQPGDPEKAAIKSSLSYILGGVLVIIGLIPCVLFFKTFRATPFSLLSAAGVIGWIAWKLHRSLPGRAVAMQAWRESKAKGFGSPVFTEATKGEIRWAEPAALEASVRSARKANRLAVPFLILAGAGLIALGIFLRERTEAFLQRAVHGAGVVVELVASHSSDGTTWAPVVEFEVEGRTYRFKDSVSSSPPSWARGDTAEVLYDPARPSDARIDRGIWNRGVPFLVTTGGAVFFSLGIWVALRRRREPAFPSMQRI